MAGGAVGAADGADHLGSGVDGGADLPGGDPDVRQAAHVPGDREMGAGRFLGRPAR